MSVPGRFSLRGVAVITGLVEHVPNLGIRMHVGIEAGCINCGSTVVIRLSQLHQQKYENNGDSENPGKPAHGYWPSFDVGIMVE
jgi:hypothetical protein